MNRNGLIKHVEFWKDRLGSYAKVANKCGINGGALSTILKGTYGANEASMLQRIARALNYRESDWNLARDTINYKITEQIFNDAKEESMWFAISNKAGSGKTAALEDLFNQDSSGTVTFIQAEEWSGRQFLIKLIEKTIGEKAMQGHYKNMSQLLDMIVNYFNDMSLDRPILLIDEADKLRPAALRQLIPIYNRTEDRLGVILSGTENFEKEMRAGVRTAKKGYDELESRFGRTYAHLPGLNRKEVERVCFVNGVKDMLEISSIWESLDKVKKQATVKTDTGQKDVMIDYVEDLRRLKRIVKGKLLSKKRAA